MKNFVRALLATLLLSCVSISVSDCSIFNPSSTQAACHTGSEYLDSNNKYFLHWNISDEAIYFQVTAETLGYVGFGISPNGAMTGADILIAGVNSDGSFYSSDYHGVGNSAPVLDDHSDWTVTSATETDTHTTIHFHRLLNTCDPNDFKITDATMRFIWALGKTDEISYHDSTRGTKSINLFLPDEQEFEPAKLEKLDMLVTMKMPAQHTSYWCSIHKGDVFSQKQHIVGFDAILDNEAALQHTHHFIVYRCIASADENPEDIFDPWVNHLGEHCHAPSNASFPFAKYCSTYSLYIWSKGGKRLVFPPNMGLPMPEQLNRREYFALEIHYDNPGVINGLEFATGARMYYTSQVREIDVGLILMAHNVDPQLTVPPMVTDYIVNGHCSSECTDKFLPDSGITIFNNLFHAHLAGRKLKFRHFRGNVELPWVDVDDYYDFDYQQNKPLTNLRKVERGDQLTVECTYDSTKADGGRAVIGGQSTHEEMCEVIFYYYPRQSMFYCASSQDMAAHFNLIGVTNYTRKDSPVASGLFEYEILEPANLAGDYRESVSFKVNWTQEFRTQFQNVKRYGEHIGVCSDGKDNFDGVVKYPENLKVYVPQDECQQKGGASNTALQSECGMLLFLFLAAYHLGVNLN